MAPAREKEGMTQLVARNVFDADFAVLTYTHLDTPIDILPGLQRPNEWFRLPSDHWGNAR